MPISKSLTPEAPAVNNRVGKNLPNLNSNIPDELGNLGNEVSNTKKEAEVIDNIPPPLPCSVTQVNPLLYVTLASVIASIGGILFGYDIGIISGALLLLRKEFSLSCFEQEMVVSSVLMGSFCASFFGGNIVDRFGRKTAIILSSILFIAGAVILSLSSNFSMLISGRVVVGVAVSISVTAECTYISEISPPNRRGMMVSFNEVGITVGFLFAYLLNYLFIAHENGWQYMFAAAVIPATLQALGIIFMPPSPHYLILKGKTDQAENVLKLLRRHSSVAEEIKVIKSALDSEKKRRYIDLLSSSNNMRGRMALGMILVFLQQFSGHANVLYYAPTVFQYFGFCSDVSATLITVGLGVVKVVATVFAVLMVDKLGRRFLLLLGCLLMASSLIILGLITVTEQTDVSTLKCSSQFKAESINNTSRNSSNNYPENGEYHQVTDDYILISTSEGIETPNFIQIINDSKLLENSHQESNYTVTERSSIFCKNCSNLLINNKKGCPNAYDISLTMKLVSVISLMTFVCAYGISYGPVTWLVLSEIFPTALRGRAISIATCINWGSNIIVSLTFLDLLHVLGVGETFILYGCISTGAAIFVFFCIPETKNKSLEEITCQLSKGFLQKKFKPCATSISQRYNVSTSNN